MLTLLLALIVQITFAQEQKVSGMVSDESGSLPGVSVVIKGTTTGTETDFDGKYTIMAKRGAILSFSYIGYKTVEKTVGISNVLDVTLSQDSNTLDEIVVIGYGTTTKKSFTGTASVVSTENIDAKAVSNIAQALIGEASGVTVTRTDGRPGASATIRIRGFSSIEGNRAPLYVVDGVPFTGDINSINPNDIASTTILKDASATAIYGSRGANGVVVLTTKRGEVGKDVIEFDIQTSFNQRTLPRYNLVNNEERYMGLVYDGLKNTGEFTGEADPAQYALDNLFADKGVAPLYNMWNVADGNELIDPATGSVRPGVTRKFTPTDWFDAGYRTGVRNEMNFKTSGGNDKTRHYFSLGKLSDEGFIQESQYDRYSARLNVTTKPIDRVKIGTNLDYSYSEYNDATGYGGGNVTYMLDFIPTIYPLYLRDTNGDIVVNPNTNNQMYDFGDNSAGNARDFSATYNGVGESIYNINRTKRHSINGNVNLVLDIAKGLTFESTYGVNIYSSNLDNTRNSIQGSAGVALGGTLFKSNETYTSQNLNQILRYNKTFGQDHNFDILAAHESFEATTEDFNLSKKGIVNLNPNAAGVPENYLDQNGVSSGSKTDTSLESYFTQANYNYAGKYYISTTLRRDGSSRFFKNKWGTFWSVGTGWIISEENFLKSSDVVNFLKLKASYGYLGDQGNAAFAGQLGFNIENLLGATSLVPRAVVDPNITWETSNQFQTGVELELFNGAIEADLDYYIKTTSNLYVNKRLSPSTGDAIILTNDGELVNRGFEFNVTGNIVRNEDFRLSLTVNGEMFNNEITRMPIENATGKPKAVNIDGRYGQSKGRSIYDFYIREWAGVNAENGDAQWIEHWVDANNDGEYTSGEGILDMLVYTAANPDKTIQERITNTYADATRKYVDKSLIPTVRGAFRVNTSYKSFSLSTQFGYSLGGYGYDSNYAVLMSNGKVGASSYHVDMENRWMNPGDITDVPRLYSNENIRVNGTSSRFITSTDYLALNNVRLGYNVPSRYLAKIALSSVNLWVSGDNLFLLSARDGFNPTTSVTATSDRYTYNPISNYTLGVRIKF
ncbi:putative outer membrane protein, probably involved in nutrient binding [Polaribacter irgensii 23-P]|uniref:Putative outer membrane protein, probably involved in nutrient binding n=1 Tax=Polaribacter irgensii 23-P TaxID=313594 RepID=A4C374_9FLAO|nr:SusC/RagA family TonB-linked outer membrane protein [Polaribacter irgensii]EAR11469.1 putative outer membrane protein, probably involved in nutrient binding [Polaribacter irgensii 23-P]